jgi:hypothetical protein
MQSMRRTEPVLVVKVVSRTKVFGRYPRSTVASGSTGLSFQRPLLRSPSSDAKQAPASKRGRHSQSMDPSRATRAAVWVSPMRA